MNDEYIYISIEEHYWFENKQLKSDAERLSPININEVHRIHQNVLNINLCSNQKCTSKQFDMFALTTLFDICGNATEKTTFTVIENAHIMTLFI